MKNLIAAYDKRRGIGKNGDLLWQRDLPADLQHFKQLTTGQAIIMGRLTFMFDLKERLLPQRQSIVISRQRLSTPGITVAHSIEEAFRAVEPGREAFIIGGGTIFQQALPLVDRLYITEVATTADADVFFPAISPADWQEISRETHKADDRNKYDYDFVVYTKRQ